jgi:hypothetical protein
MAAIIRAIVIDPQNRSLEYRDIEDTLPAFHNAVGADLLDCCYPFAPARECLWVAEYGALQNPPLPHFRIVGYRWPIYGKALLIGYGRAGETRSTTLTVDELYSQIDFE